MQDTPTERKHSAELLRTALFWRCKLLWSAGLSAKFIIYVLGVAVLILPSDGKTLGLVALVLGFASEGLLWWSDCWKSAAQGLHRKLDLEDSFGWSITKKELADYLARFTGKLDPLCGKAKGSYFASQEPAGTKRALQNLRESAWWSMHLGESMGWVFALLILLIIGGSIFLLNVSIITIPLTPAQTPPTNGGLAPLEVVNAGVIKIVTSVLLFIISYGLLKLAVGYFSFASQSRQIREKAEALQDSDCSDQVAAIKLWQDYHLARGAAPLLPNWIWKAREKKLNSLFGEYLAEGNL